MDGEAPPADIVAALRRMGLCRDVGPRGRPLTGGVSSDIWLVALPGGPVCVKRALAKLKVAADWRAPVSRNLYAVSYTHLVQFRVGACVRQPHVADADDQNAQRFAHGRLPRNVRSTRPAAMDERRPRAAV